MSGAPNSRSLFKRLFLLIILLYKSLRSDVAKRPPSNCTIGRKSGGITGTTSKIIHSGLFPDSLNASTASSLLTILALFCPDESLSAAFISADSPSRSIACNYSLTALKGILYDYKPVNAHVNVDERHYDFKNVWLAPTMKGKFYGGGMKVAPNQDRNSDRLSLVVVHHVSRIKLLSILPTVFSGNHIKKDKVITVLEGQNIDVEFDCVSSIQLDGETFDNVSKYSVKIYSKRK